MSISGIPPFAGFFSKLIIIWAAVQAQQFVIARSYLKEALILAQPSGEIRRFLDEGEAVQSLINTLQFDDAALQTYANKISNAFPNQQTNQKQTATYVIYP